MDHNKRNRFCWEIESDNDTKNNKHISFNQTIDTTAVYYRYNCSFGKTKSFRPRCRVKFGAQHTPLSQRFSELVKKNIPFFHKICIFPTLNDAQRCALPCLKKVPFLIVFCSRIGTPLTREYPPPRGGCDMVRFIQIVVNAQG